MSGGKRWGLMRRTVQGSARGVSRRAQGVPRGESGVNDTHRVSPLPPFPHPQSSYFVQPPASHSILVRIRTRSSYRFHSVSYLANPLLPSQTGDILVHFLCADLSSGPTTSFALRMHRTAHLRARSTPRAPPPSARPTAATWSTGSRATMTSSGFQRWCATTVSSIRPMRSIPPKRSGSRIRTLGGRRWRSGGLMKGERGVLRGARGGTRRTGHERWGTGHEPRHTAHGAREILHRCRCDTDASCPDRQLYSVDRIHVELTG